MHIMLCQYTLCWSACTADMFFFFSWCCIILLVRVEISTRWCFATPIKLGGGGKSEERKIKTSILWVGMNVCVLSHLKGKADDETDIIWQWHNCRAMIIWRFWDTQSLWIIRGNGLQLQSFSVMTSSSKYFICTLKSSHYIHTVDDKSFTMYLTIDKYRASIMKLCYI